MPRVRSWMGSSIFMIMPSPTETLWIVAGVALFVHLVFKQTETRQPFWLLVLLIVIPACLTFLYIPHAGSTIQAAMKVFSLFWSTLATSILVYRVSPWHPLAKYPGPLVCKLTKFHLAYLSLGGKQFLYYSELHKKYGDVVRIGPNELSIRNVDSVIPLLGPDGFQKGPFWSGRISQYRKTTTPDNATEQEHLPVSPLVAIVDKQEHARRRRPWTRGFSPSAVKAYESMVIKRTLQLVEVLLSKNLKGAVDLASLINFFGYDVMTDVAFGGGSEMLRDGDVAGRLATVKRAQKTATFTSHVPWLGAIILSYPAFTPDSKRLRMHARERVIRRIKEGSPYKDLFYYLIGEDDVGTCKPTIAEVVSDGALAIVAGSDTTSDAITFVLYFLMLNPTAYKRLQAEIDGMGNNIMDCATQASLPYLNAVLNEGLRLLPPVLSGVQRAAEEGSGGRMAGSIFIPEGNSASIHTYSIQRDPRYFSPLPDSFLPERWLPEDQRLVLEPNIFNSEQEYIHNTAAFIPFSIGPAGCAGKNFAWMEMRMAVSVIVSRLDLKLDPSCDPKKWYEGLCDYFNTTKGPLPTLLSPRQSVKA